MHRQIESMAAFLHIRKCCTVGGRWRSPPTHRIFNCKYVRIHPLAISLMFTWDQPHLHMLLWASTALCVHTHTCRPNIETHTHTHTLCHIKHLMIWATQKYPKSSWIYEWTARRRRMAQTKLLSFLFFFFKKSTLGYSVNIPQNVGLHVVSQFCSVMRTSSEKSSKLSKIGSFLARNKWLWYSHPEKNNLP